LNDRNRIKEHKHPSINHSRAFKPTLENEIVTVLTYPKAIKTKS